MIPEPLQIRDITRLEPALRIFIEALCARYAEAYPGRTLKVLETLRTPERQEWLWQHGRGPNRELRKRAKVTWTRVSRHQANAQGLAEACDLGVMLGAIFVRGTDALEMARYQDMVVLGLLVASELDIRVRNLGAETGRDWFHWELRR